MKGGGKEGQGPKQKKGKGKKSKMATVAAVDDDNKELFAFTCMSNFANVAEALQVPKSQLGTCIDSGASQVYSPDSSKFANYKSIDCNITMADGRQLKAVGMGDLEIDMLNGLKTTTMMFKNAIHAPQMAFTLISISRLSSHFQEGNVHHIQPERSGNSDDSAFRWTV